MADGLNFISDSEDRNLREGPISFPCFTFQSPNQWLRVLINQKPSMANHTSAKVPASRISRRLSGAPETLNPNPTNRDVLTVCDQCTARAFGWHWPIFDGIVICHPRVLSWRPLLAPRRSPCASPWLANQQKRNVSDCPYSLHSRNCIRFSSAALP